MNNPGYIMEAKFKTDSYDYITGNSVFYKFLGERLYTTFDSIIADGMLPALEKAIAERSYSKPFILDICANDGRTQTMVCRLLEQDDPDCTLIRMTELEKASEKYLSSEAERLEADALLSQHDCVYYSYDRTEDTVTCYRCDGERKDLCKLKSDEFRKAAANRLPESSDGEIEKFIGELKNGTRSFTGVFSAAERPLVFSGTAIYTDGVHIRTVGSFGSSSADPTRELVRRDQLTGLILKEDITNYAKRSVGELKRHTVLVIIDIDDFKFINDRHGHSTGDAVLKKCADIIEKETAACGKAGRIGGDEFLVVLDNISDREALRCVLRAVKNNISEAYSEEKDGFRVTISIGASEYPDNAGDYDTLFRLTDYLLYRAKHKGKNRYIVYEPEKHGSVEDILRSSVEDAGGIVGRKGLNKAEVVCRIADMLICGGEYSADSILKDISEHFGIERIVLYDKASQTAVIRCGSEGSGGSADEAADYISDEELSRRRRDGVTVVNNIETFAYKNPDLYMKLLRQGIYSFMHREITGKSGKSYIMSCESVSAFLTWNLEDMRYFRILDKVLSSVL